jgi:hypothetical protein
MAADDGRKSPYGPKARLAVIRSAATTASDTVRAKLFAKPFIPSLGKAIKPVASSASPATTAVIWKTVDDIFSILMRVRRAI